MHSEYFYDEIISASHESSENCAQRLSEALKIEFSAHAVTLYSFLKNTNRLTLRAQAGFSYSDYDLFELPLQSTAGKSITRETIITEELGKVHNNFLAQRMAQDKTFGLCHFVPLFDTPGKKSGLHIREQNVFGVACIYTDKKQSKIQEELLNNLSTRIGSVYRHSVKTDRANLRRDVTSSALSSKDLNSLFHKFLAILSEKWGFEASSIFINDQRNDTLRMRATTGITSQTPMIERNYNLLEESGPTVECYRSGKMIALTDNDAARKPNMYAERVSGARRSIVFLPIFDPVDNGGKAKAIGVLRTSNKIVVRDSCEKTVCHGWEDIEVLSFAAEMMGAITHIYRHVDSVTWNFERALHGITKPIKAAQLRLNDINKYSQATQILPKPHDYYLTDSISYLNALEWQITKHTSREKYKRLKTERILIYGNVIAKIEAFIRAQYKSYNIDQLLLNSIAENDYKQISPIIGNEKALQTVFRNLVENAMKYHKSGENKSICDIKISCHEGRDFVYVLIEDQGFGIPDNDVDKLFLEGTRGWNAIRRDPTGMGIGLSDSLSIMTRLGGDIILESNSSPTKFKVALRKWRD